MRNVRNDSIFSKEMLFQVVLIFIVFLFYSFDKNHPLIEFHEIIFFLNYVIASIIINYFLFPIFIYRKKYIAFLLIFFTLIGLVVFIEETILEKIFFPDTRGKYFPHLMYTLLDILPPILILSGFKLAWDATVKQKELDDLKIMMKESELQFLKSQINPHFLFNNLNNLYAHAIENSTKTPEIILSLSSILRYMLYECKAEYVPLENEKDQLKNFIHLSEMQIEGRGKANFKCNNFISGYYIAPLILTVFIENAFKHSSSSQTENIDIDIELNVNDSGLMYFKCQNTFQKISNTANLAKGIGLLNVKKRLNLIYPNLHELKILQSENIYSVELKIDLNKTTKE